MIRVLWPEGRQLVQEHHCNPPSGKGLPLAQQWRCPSCGEPRRWDGHRWRSEQEFRAGQG